MPFFVFLTNHRKIHPLIAEFEKWKWSGESSPPPLFLILYENMNIKTYLIQTTYKVE
jgi:hypothetical protein